MIVWNGLGILPPIAALVFMFIFAKTLPDSQSEIGIILTFVFTGIFSWVFGKKWNAERIVIDEETGQPARFKNGHTLFWIPMQYVGVLCCAFAVYMLFLKSGLQGSIAAVLMAGFLFAEYKYPSANPHLEENLSYFVADNSAAKTETPTNISNNKLAGNNEASKEATSPTTEKWKPLKDMTEEEKAEYYKRYQP